MEERTGRTPIQNMAMLFGVIFLGVGVLGFVPGITQHFGRLDVYDAPGAKLLGIFAVNWIHNLAHIAFGIAGLAMASSFARARSYFLVGGTLYLGLWVYGLIIELRSEANFIALNNADNWLHLVLGATMIGTGIVLGKSVAQSRARTYRHAT